MLDVLRFIGAILFLFVFISLVIWGGSFILAYLMQLKF